MEIAKVTSKGQITIPIAIRKSLGVREGDKVLFVEQNGQIVLMNSSMDALRQARRGGKGRAARRGRRRPNDARVPAGEMRCAQ